MFQRSMLPPSSDLAMVAHIRYLLFKNCSLKHLFEYATATNKMNSCSVNFLLFSSKAS